jgi:hypothetical protein
MTDFKADLQIVFLGPWAHLRVGNGIDSRSGWHSLKNGH